MQKSLDELKEELKEQEMVCGSFDITILNFKKISLFFLNEKRGAGGSQDLIEKGEELIHGTDWKVYMPEFLKLFANDVDHHDEDSSQTVLLQHLGILWKEKQRRSLICKKRDELLKTIASLKPLNCKSSFVAFLLCMQRLNLSKLLRNILPKIYACYISAEMKGFDLILHPSLKRLANGQRWILEGSDKPIGRLHCLDSKCNAIISFHSCYVKSLYFEWLETHFLEDHGCCLNDHLQNVFNCDHKEIKSIKSKEHSFTVFEVCSRCGKLQNTRVY